MVRTKPSGVKMNPEPLPARISLSAASLPGEGARPPSRSSRALLKTSTLTTAGLTFSTARMTAREYSSRSAPSSGLAAGAVAAGAGRISPSGFGRSEDGSEAPSVIQESW